MAPMTRLRADASGRPAPIQVEYYRQRATAGLIVTEGTYPSEEGRGYPHQPGIVTADHQDGWARIVEAVHSSGGAIAVQLMHAGRVSHPAVTGTDRVVAPSAIAVSGDVHTRHALLPYPEPHALEEVELAELRKEFTVAARRAIDMGADAIELHAANGYLLHQFLAPSSNLRTDTYGGSPQSRARFVIEIANEVAEAITGARVGIRLSPGVNIQDTVEADSSDMHATYKALAEGLEPLGLAYVSVVHPNPKDRIVQEIRHTIGAPLIANTGFTTLTTRERAEYLITSDLADAVAVGRPFIANPDLVHRWSNRLPENQPNPETFYSTGEAGYTDYKPVSRHSSIV